MSPYAGSRVLVVDDAQQARDLVLRVLERNGFVAVGAADAAEARTCLAGEEFELVLCDVRMPGESGFDLVDHIRAAYPSTAIVMVTGVDDAESAQLAIGLGAYGYIIKPFSINEIVIGAMNALRRRTLELEARKQVIGLEEAVEIRTRELQAALGSLHEAQEETVRRLSRLAEFRDDQTGQHIQRVALYCELLARKLGLEPERCELLRLASPLHDVGKVGIPDGILLKPGPLTASERRLMQQHAEIGYRMLADSGQPLLDLGATLALTHHEHYDGSGYPRGLAGEEIPIEGRIAAVADVFDALTSDRIYRPAFPVADAVTLLRKRRGTHFDPAVLDAFVDSLDEVLALRRRQPKSLPEAA